MQPQNPGKLLKVLGDVQRRASAVQKEIAEAEFEGTSGGGLVKVKVNGNGELLGLAIHPDAMSEGSEVLSELIIAASRQAQTQKEEFSKKKLATIAAGALPFGMKLPGLGG